MKEIDFKKRSSEIDFLRGVAVILVLFSHHWVFQPLNEMGWVGVDLFFVLSGFLVSGLLFQEYKKHGDVKPGLFLIRRGFKIYPLFYLAIGITFILLYFFPDSYVFPESKRLFLNTNGLLIGLAIECFFLQSYFFGYWGHTWSLSVEEIFYFSLAFLIYLLIRKNKLGDRRYFNRIALGLLLLVLLFRLVQNYYCWQAPMNYTAFHLRCDALFFGVLIAYHYHFNQEWLRHFYNRYKILMRLFFIPLLCYVPFIPVLKSFFILTIGFTFIYLAFGIMLLHFLFEDRLLQRVARLLGNWCVRTVATIGFYSYSIYLFHVFVVRFIVGEDYAHKQYLLGYYSYGQVLLSFGVYVLLSISIGIGMSRLVELPLLRIRDRYFPRRAD